VISCRLPHEVSRILATRTGDPAAIAPAGMFFVASEKSEKYLLLSRND
jgi:hypothetical protein